MTTALKQRIVGAIFILSLGVILIPVILDKPRLGEDPEQEMLSHVIPDTPALPDVSEVSKIHYVFNDITPEPTQPAEPVPTPEPTNPAPILTPSDLAATQSLPIPLPPELAVNEATDPLPDEGHGKSTVAAPATVPLAVIEESISAEASVPDAPVPATSVSKEHIKASATLAEASQAQWTIQLGAFSSEQNAKALVQKLSKGGFNPYLRQMAHDSLVRVYVSPGIPREQAMGLVAKLDTEYGLKGIVVRYFQQ